MKNKTKVVIVGAGIIGSTIAYNLSSHNELNITIIESKSPCSGASSHSFAWLNSFGKEPSEYHQLNRLAMGMWNRFSDNLGNNVGFHQGGEIHLENTSDGAKKLKKQVKRLQEEGYPCYIITKEELNKIEPRIVTDGITAISFSEIDGQVEPCKVVKECLKRAQDNGVEILLNTPVIGLKTKQNKVRIVETSKGKVECDILILASGIETTKIAAMANINVPQRESPGIVIRTDPIPRIIDSVSVIHFPVSNSTKKELLTNGIHIRQSTEGIISMGGGNQETINTDNSQEYAEEIKSLVQQYLPDIKQVKPYSLPIGHRPMPIDGLPIIGFSNKVPNVYVTLMHSGVTLAPLIGEVVSLEIINKTNTKMLEPYRLTRFE